MESKFNDQFYLVFTHLARRESSYFFIDFIIVKNSQPIVHISVLLSFGEAGDDQTRARLQAIRGVHFYIVNAVHLLRRA